MACAKMAVANMGASLSERSLLIAWAVVAAIAIAWQLGGYPLLDVDEGRNAEVGREMAATNDYVMPRLDGLPYLDKPIVYFAAEAATMEVAGATEFAARFPSWLFTIATALLLAWFAARVEVSGALAAIIFLSMPLTIAFARTVIFDSALSFFITLALIAFYLEMPALAWAAMAFGVITKGPVAIAVPMIVAIPYAIWRKKISYLASTLGLILFVVIIAPWVWAISYRIPDFLRYVLVTETAQRLTTGALKRTGPPWYFVPYLIGGAFPWIFCLFGERRTENGEPSWLDRYLLLWIAVPFVFFSISQSKRPQYILPLMPAIALYVARRANPGRAAAIATAVAGAVLLAAIPFVHVPYGLHAAIVIGICALTFGTIAIFARGALAWIALTVPMLAIPIVSVPTMNELGQRRSTKTFIASLHPYVANADVVGIEAFTGSMAFYLRRPIVIVSPDGEELTSNYIVRHYGDFAGRSALQRQAWLQEAFKHPGTVFIVREPDTANRSLVEAHGARLIAKSPHFVAYTMPR